MLETFEGKKIPCVPDLNDLLDTKVTQEDLCEKSNCAEIENLDCGQCLFSSLWCTRALFDQWKKQKIEKTYE